MPEPTSLVHPWLVAVWPGMGHVALNAGIYLLSRLDMTVVAELETGDLFDIDQVEVSNGLIQAVRPPRSRVFLWTDPDKRHDLVVLLGEAQPSVGKFAFCRQVMRYAKEHGVERVLTFAAMATPMHPAQPARVFGAATDPAGVEELKRLELQLVEDGHIGGLNGVLLGAAAEAGLRGTCLLGEMPHVFAQLPFPKASHAILEVFTGLAGLDLDLGPLAELARTNEEQLGELLERVQRQMGGESEGDDEDDDDDEEGGSEVEEAEPAGLSAEAARRVEALFREAASDRSKAFALKHELDRLGAFKEYEDRFLDLFRKPEA